MSVFVVFLVGWILLACVVVWFWDRFHKLMGDRDDFVRWDIHDDQRRIARNGFKSRMGTK